MEANHWVESSQYLYSKLLRLYPAAHRAAYETEMFQLFTDQCRTAYEKRGGLGLFALWVRILIDVSKSVLWEHLTDARARLGLLEASPNEPLPWKGVALVLVPGLVFLISQIAQLLGENWYFVVYYRSAYVLMLPVLVVWLLTRRFPVWGLIPLGLLFETLWTYGNRVDFGYLSYKLPFLSGLLIGLEKVSPATLAVWGCSVLVCLLLWHQVRSRTFSRTAWLWLGLYGFLILAQIGLHLYRYMFWWGLDWETFWNSADKAQYISQVSIEYLYSALPFLVLIFIGIFFVERNGRLSFLLPLGYLLPAIIYGRYGEWNDALPFVLVGSVVMVYRLVVAIVAPLWLVRAAPTPARKSAIALPAAIGLLAQMGLNLGILALLAGQADYRLSWPDFAITASSSLILAAGLGLAATLYQNQIETPSETTSLPPLPAS